MKQIILVLLAMVVLGGCANTAWIEYTQTHYVKPVYSSDGVLLYYKQNTLTGNPRWIGDFNGCLKVGHERRGLDYSKSMWQISEMCYKHEDCIRYVNECLLERGYILIPQPARQEYPPEKPITSTPVTPPMGTEKIVTVTWTFANIRSDAGDSYPVVTTVKQGDKLTVIGESGEWFNVRLENGQEGWISNGVVK
jgi:uncharacterized protein YgiM (DUF1202 family)